MSSVNDQTKINETKINVKEINKTKINESKINEMNDNQNDFSIFDENTKENEELAALFKPVKKRFKYTIYYNAFLIALSYKYGQNVNSLLKKYFPKRMRGIFNLILFATLHSFAFVFLLVGGNCLVLGLNPITFSRKHKEITERIIEQEGSNYDSVYDFFKGPIKKIEQSKVDGKSFNEKINKI